MTLFSDDPPKETLPWEGAFGIRFGQLMNVADGQYAEDWSQLTYSMRPPLSNREFSTYQLSATPKTGRIFQISASQKFQSRFSGRSVYIEVAQVLTSKYGQPSTRPERNYDAYGWAKGKVTIDLSWQDSAQTMVIDYIDKNLTEEAHAEKAELVKTNLDRTGL